MSRVLETTIEAVTVLSDRAVITRRGQFEVTPEDHSWLISPLPMTIAPDSFRVKGKGTVAVKFVAIATETIVTTESIDEKIAPLNQRISDLKRELQMISDQISSVQLQQNFVTNLSESAVSRFARNLATGETDLSQTESLLKFVGKHHQNFSQQIQTKTEQQRQLTLEIEALEQQKKLLQHPERKRHYALSLAVEVSGSGQFMLEVRYQVSQAHWLPRYDLSVDTNHKLLTLDYVADISQSTGEDWCDADLTISTAYIQQGTIPPKLNPWYLNIRQPPQRQPSFAKRRSELSPAAASAPMPMAMMADEAKESEEAEVWTEAIAPPSEVRQAGQTVTFHVGKGGNIPSDGNPHQINLFQGEYPIELNHFAIPRLVSFAYLQAQFINPTDGVTLLAGVANVFRDQTFVGKSNLARIAPGQSMHLNLGIDERLHIEKNLSDRQVDKTLISQLRRITYAYTIKIQNLSDQAHTLILQDQIPVSRSEKIKINLQKTDPKIEPTKLGILEWQLAIASQETQTIFYQFVVECPPALEIQGLGKD